MKDKENQEKKQEGSESQEIMLSKDIPLSYEEFLESNNLTNNQDIIQFLISVASGTYHKKISKQFIQEDNVMEMYLNLNEFITQSNIHLDSKDQELREVILKLIKTKFPNNCFSFKQANTILKEGTQNYKDFEKLYEWVCEQLAHLFDKASDIFQFSRKVDSTKTKAQIRTLQTIKTAGEFGYNYQKTMGGHVDEHITEDDNILMAEDVDFMKPMNLWSKNKRKKNKEEEEETLENKTR